MSLIHLILVNQVLSDQFPKNLLLKEYVTPICFEATRKKVNGQTPLHQPEDQKCCPLIIL